MEPGCFLRFRRELSFSGAVVLALLVTAGTRVRTGFFSDGCSEVRPSGPDAGCGVGVGLVRERRVGRVVVVG